MKRIILTVFLILAVFQIFAQRVFENKYIVVHRTWGDYVVNARGAKVSITDTINGEVVPMTDGDTIVYVNSSTGLTPITTFTREPGTEPIFALNRNTTYSGSITANDDSLKFCSYGHSGTKPVISGFTTITGWTQENDTIWSKSLTVESDPEIVTINGVQYAMGRTPNSDRYNLSVNDYFHIDSRRYPTATTAQITDTEVQSATADWTGAVLVVRGTVYTDWIKGTITAHSGI